MGELWRAWRQYDQLDELLGAWLLAWSLRLKDGTARTIGGSVRVGDPQLQTARLFFCGNRVQFGPLVKDAGANARPRIVRLDRLPAVPELSSHGRQPAAFDA